MAKKHEKAVAAAKKAKEIPVIGNFLAPAVYVVNYCKIKELGG